MWYKPKVLLLFQCFFLFFCFFFKMCPHIWQYKLNLVENKYGRPSTGVSFWLLGLLILKWLLGIYCPMWGKCFLHKFHRRNHNKKVNFRHFRHYLVALLVQYLMFCLCKPMYMRRNVWSQSVRNHIASIFCTSSSIWLQFTWPGRSAGCRWRCLAARWSSSWCREAGQGEVG